MGAGERWKQGDLAESALVSASQRWWAMIQVLLQLSHWGDLLSAGFRTKLADDKNVQLIVTGTVGRSTK